MKFCVGTVWGFQEEKDGAELGTRWAECGEVVGEAVEAGREEIGEQRVRSRTAERSSGE